MLKHKTRPKSSSDLGKIKQRTGFISVTVMLDRLQSGLLYKELDVPRWTHIRALALRRFLPCQTKVRRRKGDEGRCFGKKVGSTKAGVSAHGTSLLLTCGQAGDQNLNQVLERDSPRQV